jgi:WD40 repeat protein
MRMLRETIAAIIILLGIAFVMSAASRAERAVRLVPQLGLTDLGPIKVSFAPNDPNLLLVVNNSGRLDTPGRLDIFDLSSGQPVKVTEIAAGAITDAKFASVPTTPRDKTHILTGGADGTVRLWTLDGKPVAEPFKAHDGGVYSVAFSPDGTRIASGGVDGTVRLWTLEGKPAAEPFKGHDSGVWSIAFSPDGTRIASGGFDGTVRLWTLDGKSAAEPFKGHDSFLGRGFGISVAFSPDGTRIASGAADRTVRLWTLDGKPAAEPLKGHEQAILSVAFSPDGTRIVSGSFDGSVRLL